MLNLQGFIRLLVLPIGALSGFGSARDMKAGISATILFTFAGLLLGFATSWVPFIWILVAGLAPVLLALIIYGHR
jgi:hypothetical protein